MEHKKNLLLMVPMLHQGGFERVCVQTARLLAEDFSVTVLIFTDKDIHYDVRGIEIVNIDVPSVKSRAGQGLQSDQKNPQGKTNQEGEENRSLLQLWLLRQLRECTE